MNGYLINKHTDVNEVKNKWSVFGLLDSVKEENKDKTAMSLEIIQKFYIFNNLVGDDYVKTLIFPVIVRIMRDNKKIYTFLELVTEVMNVFAKFSDLAESFDFEEFKKEKVLQKELDREACLVSKFCSEYQCL